MSTLATMISDTETHLLAGDRDELNRLTASVDNQTDQFQFDMQLGGIQPGAYLGIDLEVLYVWSVEGQIATVERGMLGSTPAAHALGEMVYVNPHFSKFEIAKAINIEIRDLSAPPNGLFAVKKFFATTKPVQKTYEIPVPNVDLYYILEVRYNPPGPEFRWDRITRWDYDVLRDMPTSGPSGGNFSSGQAIRLEPGLYPGRQLRIVYATGFSELSVLTDDAVTISGLPASAIDLPSLGAAARLMGVREAKRSFVESEVDTRRASEVPVGAATRAAQTLLLVLNERIKTEYFKLIQQWPERR